MLRRKHKKADSHLSNGSFSYSRVDSDVRSNSLQEESEVSHSLDLDADVKPASSWSADDKKIFEDQLETLQDQLIATMMENQKLAEQVQSMKEEDVVEQLNQEKRDLQTKLDKLEKVLHSLNADRRVSDLSIASGDIDMGDYEIVRTAASRNNSLASISPVEKHWLHPASLMNKLRKKTLDFLSDFETDDSLTKTEKPAPSLSYKRLKESCQRLGKSSKPFRKSISTVLVVLKWTNVPLSVVMFLLYMYSVWTGWLLQVILFYFIFYLSVNFLQASGLAYHFGLTSTDKLDGELVGSKFDSLGLADKVQLVKNVAQAVQNYCNDAADFCEKLHNLLLWREPNATMKLYKFLCVFFCVSLFVSNSYMFTAIGLGIGFKLFIIDHVYRKYPRVKARHDTVAQVWATLPTNAELEERQSLTHLQLQQRIQALEPPPSSINFVEPESSADITADLTEEDVSFCERFNLPAIERPLSDWQGGKRCILIDKDRPLLGAKQGRLYLTQGYLCFERSQKQTQRISDNRFSLSLQEAEAIIPCKPLAVMPGSGMAISVKLQNVDKPHIFGALLNRDEVLQRIVDHGIRMCYPWATTPQDTNNNNSNNNNTSSHTE